MPANERHQSVALFAGVDRAIFASTFAVRLRAAGVTVTLTASERAVAALDTVAAPHLGDLYWLLRISMLGDHRQLGQFDRVFTAVFGAEAGRLHSERRGQQRPDPSADDDILVPIRRPGDDVDDVAGSGLPWATLPSVAFDLSEGDDDVDQATDTLIPERRPSLATTDPDRPFDLLDDTELDEAGRLLEHAARSWPERSSRRRRPTRAGGPVALRSSMRRAMRTGGDVFDLVRTTTRRRPRRVVMLLDVSGSMEHHVRAYLHVMRPLAQAHHAEVFAFATELTRVTSILRRRSAADAIEHLNAAVGDRFSGTQIATSLAMLLRHRSWNTSVRGSVVVICSDGWDAGAPDDLARQMRRLRLLAHRVIWVNPRAGIEGFEPLTGGMSAALPHCDHFFAGNTVRSMTEVIAAIVSPETPRLVAG